MQSPDFGTSGDVAPIASSNNTAPSMATTGADALRAGPQFAEWRRVAPWLIALGLVSAIAISYGFINRSRTGEFATQGGLIIDAENLNFGTVWPLTDFRWRLPIRNASASVVRVLGMRTSCSCTTVGESAFEVAPGETKDVELIIDLSPGANSNLAMPLRDFSVLVVPLIDGGFIRQAGWEVKGVVRNPVDIVPRELLISDALIHGSPFPAQTASLQINHDIAEISANSGVDFATAHVERDSSNPRLAELRIELSPDVPTGDFQFDVSIQVDPGHGNQSFTISYPVFGAVVHDLQTFPPVIALGRVERGSGPEEQLLLRTRSGRPFRILGVEAPDNIAWRPLTALDGSTPEQFASVRVENASDGYVNHKIFIRAEIGGEEPAPLEIPLSYVGVPRRMAEPPK